MLKKIINIFNNISISRLRIISIVYLVITLGFYVFNINNNFIGSDYGNYIQGANSIFTSLPYSTHGDPNIADNFRPPGYPFIIAISQKISQYYFNEIVILIQVLLFLGIYLFFLEALILFRVYTKTSIFLSSFLFSHPILIFTTTQVQSDLILSFFVCLFVYSFLLFTSKNKKQYLYLAILFISISVYFRPTYIYYIPILVIIIGLIYSYKYAFFSILIYLFTISPWILRNNIELNSNSFSYLGEIGISYHAAETLRLANDISINDAHEIIFKEAKITNDVSIIKNDPIAMKRYVDISLSKIKENPIYYILANLRGLLRVLIIPNGIFDIKENTTINVHDFIIILKTKPKELLKEINFYFTYLYIIPYLINGIIFFCVIGFFKSKNLFFENRNIFIVLTSLFIYGLLIPGPLNKSQYFLSYYIILVLFTIIYVEKTLLIKFKKSLSDH